MLHYSKHFTVITAKVNMTVTLISNFVSYNILCVGGGGVFYVGFTVYVDETGGGRSGVAR